MYIGKSPADVLIGPTVSSVDISDETIATIDIAADAITGAKIADDAINSEHYTDGSIDNVHVATGLDAVKIADGSVTNAELQYINSLSSNAQTQINTKSPIASPTFTGTVVLPNVPAIVATQLDLKSPLASPTFTGTPAVPTASATTNTTQIASTAYVRTELANLVDSAPSALDTLNELAAALGDDAAFSTTVTNSIATKLPLAGGTVSGATTFSDSIIVGSSDGELTWSNTAGIGFIVKAKAGNALSLGSNNNQDTLVLDTSGNATFAGNVGIGLTPTHNFNLRAAGVVEARFQSSDDDCQLQISSHTDESKDSILNFLSGTSGRGQIVYDHNTTAASQKMLFKTGDIAVTAMAILGDGKIGIGVTSPSAQLEVSHNTSGQLSCIIGNSHATGLGAVIQGGSTTSTYALKVRKHDGTEMHIFDGAGNVGIGNSSPSFPLDVAANSSTAIARFVNAGSSSPSGLFVNLSGGTPNDRTDYYFYATGGGGDISLFTDGGANFAGNVGIGTTAPEGLLSFDASDSNTPKIRFQNAAGVTGDAALSTYEDAAGTSLLIGSNLITGSGGAIARFNTGEESCGVQFNRTGAIEFMTGASGATGDVKMTLDVSGHLGIGVASPSSYGGIQSQLEVTSSSHASIAVVAPSSSYYGTLQFTQGSSRTWGIEATSGSADFRFNEAGTYRMAIKAGGNVGIGTISPQALLDVADVYADSGSAVEGLQLLIRGSQADLAPTGDSCGIGFGYPSANNYVKTGIINEFTAANGLSDLHFCTSASTGAYTVNKSDARMTIMSSGNIGIGTTAPAVALSIGDNSGAEEWVRIHNGSSNQAGIQFACDDDQWAIGQKHNDSQKLFFSYGAIGSTLETGPKMVIDTSGKVGIGVTDPDEALEVNGNIHLQQRLKLYDTADVNHSPIIDMYTGGEETASINFYNSERASDELRGAITFGMGSPSTGYEYGYMRFSAGGNVTALTLDAGGTGNASFAGNITAPSQQLTNFSEIRIDDGEFYFTDTANEDYWRWRRDASDNFILDHWHTGGSTANALSFNSSQNATFAGEVDINSGAWSPLRVSSSSATGGSYLDFRHNTTSRVRLLCDNVADSASEGDLLVYTGGDMNNSALRIENNNNATFAGNVSLAQGSNANPQLAIYNAERRWEFFVHGSSNDQLNIKDGTADATRMSIFNDGNVCIGNRTSTAYKLDVRGSIYNEGTNAEIKTLDTGTSPFCRITGMSIKNGGSSVDDGNVLMRISADGYNGSWYYPFGRIDIAAHGSVSGSNSPGKMTFFTGNASNTTAISALELDSSQNAYFGGHVYPEADNSKNLGSSSLRWANLYVADMQMNNEGTGGNDVDGSEGSWTIQEGEDDLFLLNRKNGKKYKFKLEAV